MSLHQLYDGIVIELRVDGNQWCAKLANLNLMEAPAGYGDTIAKALDAFTIAVIGAGLDRGVKPVG